MYNKRLEKSRAEKLTVQDFLKEVRSKFNGEKAIVICVAKIYILASIVITSYYCFFSLLENTKHECQRRVESLKQAWAIVGHKLKNHSEFIQQ